MNRKEREIARLEKRLAKPVGSSYVYYLIFLLSVVYLCDEIVSQIEWQMQSVVAQAIYAPVYGSGRAVAMMLTWSSITMIASAFASFYKPLSDRYGRKPFLIINTIGMGASLIVISLATNIPAYLIGTSILAFFVPHDVQMVYIMETAPQKHRGTVYSLSKAFATLGMMLIPLLRNLIMGNDTSRWREVYWIFGLATIVVAVISAGLIRESDVWMRSRLERLRMSEAEWEERKAQKDRTAENPGLLKAIGICLKNKQTKWLFIAAGFIGFASNFNNYYESIMNFGYSGTLMISGASVDTSVTITDMVTKALFLFPVGSGLSQLLPGILGDRLGRRKACIIMAGLATVSFIVFNIGAYAQWMPYVVGLFAGMSVGSFWGCNDIATGMLVSESVPTNMRSAALAAAPFFATFITMISGILELIAINVLGDSFAGVVCLIIGVPGLVIGLLLLARNVKETNNIDIEAVRLN